MSLTDEKYHLVAQLILWVEAVSYQHKKEAFYKIRRKILR